MMVVAVMGMAIGSPSLAPLEFLLAPPLAVSTGPRFKSWVFEIFSNTIFFYTSKRRRWLACWLCPLLALLPGRRSPVAARCAVRACAWPPSRAEVEARRQAAAVARTPRSGTATSLLRRSGRPTSAAPSLQLCRPAAPSAAAVARGAELRVPPPSA